MHPVEGEKGCNWASRGGPSRRNQTVGAVAGSWPGLLCSTAVVWIGPGHGLVFMGPVG